VFRKVKKETRKQDFVKKGREEGEVEGIGGSKRKKTGASVKNREVR